MQTVAVGWYVYAVTQSALALGFSGLASFLPPAFFALFAGHVADSYNRRVIVSIAFAFCAMGSFGLLSLVLAGSGDVRLIYACLLVVGSARAFANPAAQALTPNLVPREVFANAVTWYSSAWSTSRIIGPALGGLLYLLGPTAPFIAACTLFACASLCVAALSIAMRPQAGRGPITWVTLSAGLRFIHSRQVILGAISLDLVAVLFGGATALLPIVAQDILHVGPWGLGLLRSAPALGAIAMGAWLAHSPIQSRAGKSMLIAVAMASRGVFGFDQTLMVIYGAHAGSSLITYLTGIHFRGEPRQLVTAQILYNLVGVALFLLLFVGLRVFDPTGAQIAGLTRWAPHDAGARAALGAMALNTITPLLLTTMTPALHRLCARLAPPSGQEDLARPKFLREEVSENAVATLMLAEQEQLRLLRRLPAYCEALRDEPAGQGGPAPQTYHEAFALISQCIDRSEAGLMSRQMSPEDTEWLLNQQKRLQLLNALDDACHELWTVARDLGGASQPLRSTIVESLDTLLLTAIDAMAGANPDELELLEGLTRNHGAAMERVRKKYLAMSDDLSSDDRNRILQITSIFERAAWSLRRLGALLQELPTRV